MPILRVFFLCRKYGTASPYQGYSLILISKTELFYACLEPTNVTLFHAWKQQMAAYAPTYEYHKCIVENSPLAKVLGPLTAHLEWLGEEGTAPESVQATAAGMITVLKHAMQVVSSEADYNSKLHWKKWGDDDTNAFRAPQSAYPELGWETATYLR